MLRYSRLEKANEKDDIGLLIDMYIHFYIYLIYGTLTSFYTVRKKCFYRTKTSF